MTCASCPRYYADMATRRAQSLTSRTDSNAAALKFFAPDSALFRTDLDGVLERNSPMTKRVAISQSLPMRPPNQDLRFAGIPN